MKKNKFSLLEADNTELDDTEEVDMSIFGDDDEDDDLGDDDGFDWDSFERWADKVNLDIINEDNDTMSLSDALDRVLKANINSHDTDMVSGTYNQGVNLLIIGPAGGGKTSIIREWIRSRGLNYLELTGSQLDAQTIKGVPFRVEVDDNQNPGQKKTVVQNLNNTTFDSLDADPSKLSVLFIDEINRSYSEARASILKIVQDHRVPDHNSPTGDRLVKNLAFTIAAMNPADDAHEGAEPLDIAMLTRFTVFEWQSNKLEFIKFMDSEEAKTRKGAKKAYKHKKFTAEEAKKVIALAKMRTEIAKKLLIDADVDFDDSEVLQAHQEAQKPVLNSRTLLTALRMSNSPEDFLKWYKATCGADEDAVDDFRAYLDAIDSPDDEANAVFNYANLSTFDKFKRWEKANAGRF